MFRVKVKFKQLVSSRLLKCSFHESKRSFYAYVNLVFGRIASEEVVIQLAIQKYPPILLYGIIDAYHITVSAAKSFDFVMNIFLMKRLQTSNLRNIDDLRCLFEKVMSNKLIEVRLIGDLLSRYSTRNNAICNFLVK